MPRLFEELTDVERTHAYCGDADVARIAYDALEPVAGRAQQRKQERNRHVAEAKKAPASFVPADELSD